MNTRTVGWCSVLVLLLFPVVAWAETPNSSATEPIEQPPSLIAPRLAETKKPASETKQATTADNASTSDNVSRQEFNDALSRIEQRLDALSQSLTTLTPQTRETQKPVDNPQPTPAEKSTYAVSDKPADQAGTNNPVSPTQSEFNALRDRVYDQEVILANIAKRISQPNGPERYIVDIRGNLQSPTFRNELSDAVNEVLPREGKIHVHNRMSTTQTLTVNRKDYQIAPGDRLAVTVPTGTVTTELVGFEAPRNWTIGAPTFEERIVIGPREERRVLYQPAESVYGPTITNGAAAAPVLSTVPVETPVYTNGTTTCSCSTGL